MPPKERQNADFTVEEVCDLLKTEAAIISHWMGAKEKIASLLETKRVFVKFRILKEEFEEVNSVKQFVFKFLYHLTMYQHEHLILIKNTMILHSTPEHLEEDVEHFINSINVTHQINGILQYILM